MPLTSARFGFVVVGALAPLLASDLRAADLRVEPAKVEFRDAFARRQLLVSTDGHDATRKAEYLSRKPEIVSVDATGYLVPHANGAVEIEVKLNGQSMLVPVDVSGLEKIRPVDFATEIDRKSHV